MLQAPRSRLLLKLKHITPDSKLISRSIACSLHCNPRNTYPNSTINHVQTTNRKMSSFSNTDTGSKPADPYKAANKDEPSIEQKFSTLDKFINARKYGMMTTRDANSGKLVSRCMAVAAKEANGTELLFFTNTEAHKTDEIKEDPQTNISFLDGSGQWASVSGPSSVETDRSVVKKYYNPELKAWVGDLGDGKHDGSENDPRIGVIRVKIDTATYAITDKTFIGYAVEVAKGAVTGDTASVNKLREISSSEVQQWRSKA